MSFTDTKFVLAVMFHTVQTTAFIVLFALLQELPIWIVAASVLSVAAVSLFPVLLFRAAFAQRRLKKRRRLGALYAALHMPVALANWGLLFLCLQASGPFIAVATSLVAAVATKWLSQFVMKSSNHRTTSVGNLGLSTAMVLLAAIVVGKTKLDFGASLDSSLPAQLFIATAFSITTAVSQVLKAKLTDPDECDLREETEYSSELVVGLELLMAAIAAIAWVATMGELPLLATLIPQSGPTEWSWLHWSIVWVGAVNVAFGLVANSYLNNIAGIQVMVAVAQMRPLLAELVLIATETHSFNLNTTIDLIVASTLAMSAAAVLKKPSR